MERRDVIKGGKRKVQQITSRTTTEKFSNRNFEGVYVRNTESDKIKGAM